MTRSREEWEKIVYCATDVGEHMLKSGAEVHRVEDTVRRICTAYGAERTDVFTITSSIVVTVYVSDFTTVTETRRVSHSVNDMLKLDEYNELSREICTGLPAPERIRERLVEIHDGNLPLFSIKFFAYALASFSFSIFFGGNLPDGLAAALIGIFLCYFEEFLAHFTENPLMTALIWSVAGGSLASLSARLMPGLQLHPDLISIGNIMLFIPGIAFTNSLRDLFLGDTISGLIRFLESVLLAVVMAIGFAAAGLFFHTGDVISSGTQTAILQIITAGLGTFSFSMIFHAGKEKWGLLFLGGVLSWILYLIFFDWTKSSNLAGFLSAGILAFYAELMARVCRTPATVFSLITTVPLIPGAGLYRAMNALMNGSIGGFQGYGLSTLMFASAMSAGIIFCSPIGTRIFSCFHRSKRIP